MPNPDFANKNHLEMLLENAQNMLAHNEFEAAEALLQVIIKRDPRHRAARIMLDTIQTPPALTPIQLPPIQKHYVDYDYRTGMYEVLDENDAHVTAFVTREEAEKFARSRG